MIEYNSDNRVSYDESCDAMYVYKAQPQGRVGAVMLYNDPKDGTMVALDTDEVGTIVGIELLGISKLMKKFVIRQDRN
tara:strand:+ start:421 stop:654 length:234 start_codon:yes stop_codon:yes gene_type:complete